jgi:hypothetical protein
VNQATRVYSVQVVPAGSPLDVLRCGMHANGNVTINGTVIAGNGPISCNAQMNTGSKVYGNVETKTQSGSSNNVVGTLTTNLTKTMPSSGLYNLYLSKATAMSWGQVSNPSPMSPKLLTSTNDPYGATNAEGIYSISVPNGTSTFKIGSCRIKGTLLISMNSGTLTITGPILWEPTRPDYPILIVKGTTVNVVIQGSTTWLSESTIGMDLNGNGTTTDDLPPQYRGVIHVIGSGTSVTVNNNAFIKGLLVTDGALTTSGTATFIADTSLQSRPPMGYGQGDQLMIVPGSWIWDAPP